MRDPTKMTTAERKEEEQRQCAVLARAMHIVISEASREFDPPMLNAVAGALVSIEASVLASISDPHLRKTLRKSMEDQRPVALAHAMAEVRAFRVAPVAVKANDA